MRNKLPKQPYVRVTPERWVYFGFQHYQDIESCRALPSGRWLLHTWIEDGFGFYAKAWTLYRSHDPLAQSAIVYRVRRMLVRPADYALRRRFILREHIRPAVRVKSALLDTQAIEARLTETHSFMLPNKPDASSELAWMDGRSMGFHIEKGVLGLSSRYEVLWVERLDSEWKKFETWRWDLIKYFEEVLKPKNTEK